jgi:ketosteroid isomerase-like protein
MKNNVLTILALFTFLFLFVISCENVDNKTETTSNPKVPDKNQNIKEKVEKINSDIENIMLAGNYNDLLPYYTDDVIISPDFQSSLKGKEAIRAVYEKNKKIGLKHHSFSGTPEDIWECDNFIYERGKFGTSLNSNDHPKPLAYYSSYFTIWQKENDGSLKIKYVIWNLDFNPCD